MSIDSKFNKPKPTPNNDRTGAESGGIGRNEQELQLEFTQKLEKLNETEKNIMLHIAALTSTQDDNNIELQNASVELIFQFCNYSKYLKDQVSHEQVEKFVSNFGFKKITIENEECFELPAEKNKKVWEVLGKNKRKEIFGELVDFFETEMDN